MSRTRINEDDAPDLQSDAEAAVHAADTTSVHGIPDTSVLSTTAHDHDADYEAAGGIATHSADSTAVHGITDTAALVVDGDAAGGELAGTYPNPTVAAAHSGSTHAATQAAAEATAAGALSGHEADTTAVHGIADTANLSAVGHAHAGEDITSGTVADARIAAALARDTEVATAVSDHEAAANPHATYLTQAEGDAAYEAIGATATHAAAGDPHTGYRLESADHSHASTGLQAGTIAHTALTSVGVDDHHARDHAIGGATHSGAITAAQHGVLADVAAGHRHSDLTSVTSDQHHAQLHAATHIPTGTDPVDKFVQSTIGTLDLAIANTETVVLARVFAANELAAGQMYRFEAWFTKAGTNASSAIIRIRIGTTTLTGNIAATLTPPTNALAVPGKIEGMVQIVAGGAGGTARGNLQQFVHLAAVTVTSAINPATGTVAVNTTTANQRVELTFISGNAANTYTFRGAVMYRVA